MDNCYYQGSFAHFCSQSVQQIVGTITLASQFDNRRSQNKAWHDQVIILQKILGLFQGHIFLEFAIPRMGKRVDVILLIENVVFVVEFKVDATEYLQQDIDQVWDYALDLKNFHQPSHHLAIVPIIVATEAKQSYLQVATSHHNDGITFPLKTNKEELAKAISAALTLLADKNKIDHNSFVSGAYAPTPTIIEAAVSLYNKHSVDEITRSGAGAKNLNVTTQAISTLIDYARNSNKKVLCLVTGVPGAGKTLVGLKIATEHLDKLKGNSAVYLSGNAPLVAILQEALTRNKFKTDEINGVKTTKHKAKQAVKSFIQIIHHYRDAYLVNADAPYDHVAIFDEAQRAWNRDHTIKFMRQKKNQHSFSQSEPEFLISCLDRHKDWAVIVCLVGGGQEINTGEAGVSEWLRAILDKFGSWEVHLSPDLNESEYLAENTIKLLYEKRNITFDARLHLSASMRSFRAEKISQFIKELLDLEIEKAKKTLIDVQKKYKVILTRDLAKAKLWLKEQARGSERFGIVVSSQAQRLKPFAIDVKSPVNPIHWFLEGKEDVRSSYFLEDVATEFQVQGLELDWVCITWDGDLRFAPTGWKTYSFKGNKWQNIKHRDRQKYLVNSYRVLLTRARQGMIIVVPEGSNEDFSRRPEFYDCTYNYLKSIGLTII